MKTQVALISLLAIASTVLFFQGGQQVQLESGQQEIFEAYKLWKMKFNENQDIDMYRFSVFAANYLHVEQHNRSNSDVKLAMNQFAGLTVEEFKAKMLNKRQPMEVTTRREKGNRNFKAADSIDWVAKGAVNAIQDQGNCGSCWAFSATASLEGLNEIEEGTLQKFSEQQVTSCAPFPNMGCNGGLENTAMDYTAKAGIELESTYPYVQQTNPKTAECNYEESETVWSNTGSVVFERNDLSAMIEQCNKQPFSIAVDAGNITFQLYSSGTLSGENCGTSLDHAINVVGYQEYNGDASSPQGYWQIRNSWGTGWGINGYAQFAIQTGDGVCGMNQEPSYPV